MLIVLLVYAGAQQWHHIFAVAGRARVCGADQHPDQRQKAQEKHESPQACAQADDHHSSHDTD